MSGDEPEPGTPEYEAQTDAFMEAIANRHGPVAHVSDEDLQRLAGYLTEKHRRFPTFDRDTTIAMAVSTTVADVALVYEGILDVDDYAPDGLVGINGPNKDLPRP